MANDQTSHTILVVSPAFACTFYLQPLDNTELYPAGEILSDKNRHSIYRISEKIHRTEVQRFIFETCWANHRKWFMGQSWHQFSLDVADWLDD